MIYKKVDVQRVVGAIKSLEALGDVVSSEMYQVLSNYEQPIFKRMKNAKWKCGTLFSCKGNSLLEAKYV